MTSPTFDWRLPYEPTDKLTTFEHENAPHDHAAVLLSPLDPDSPPSSFSSGSKRSFSPDEADGYEQDNVERTQLAGPKRVRARKLPRPDDLLPALLANEMFVDNTRFLLALPDRFEYLVLLPPRFGKSVLLSTLHAFFDVHRATEFSQRFKSLAAVRDAPAGRELVHNQHLLLEFNFHSFTLYSRNLHVILPSVLDSTYRAFISKYARELNLPRGVKDLDEQKDLFPQLLDAVHRAGRSIIATVDDFDGPFRPFPPVFYTIATWGVANPQETAGLFDTKLWAPLRSATHVVHKLFVAALDWLERRLELQDEQGPRDRPNLSFVFVSDILFALPQSTDDPKFPSLEGLVALVTAGSVKSDAVDAYVDSDPRRPTWAALYYAGALLHDAQSMSYSVANYQVLELIHKQLDDFLAQRQDHRNGRAFTGPRMHVKRIKAEHSPRTTTMTSRLSPQVLPTRLALPALECTTLPPLHERRRTYRVKAPSDIPWISV
uniref:AAA-ATPase-like domain-containing protein n=1 Tax=Mycena chlorophos TaxID=658473 RepID=A0ABQ0LXF5_MYCCL|nr:predicted protein [Mycena chlorophos]